jgi:hypothetical protein
LFALRLITLFTASWLFIFSKLLLCSTLCISYIEAQWKLECGRGRFWCLFYNCSWLLHERTTTAKNMGRLKYHQTSHKLWKRLTPGMPGRSYQTEPGLPSGCQVNIKCFYAKSTCLDSNYRNISSLTLVQMVIPGYLQRTVDNYSCGLFPMIFRMVFPSWGVRLWGPTYFFKENPTYTLYLSSTNSECPKNNFFKRKTTWF